jgi:anti-sigma B factor antagonist
LQLVVLAGIERWSWWTAQAGLKARGAAMFLIKDPPHSNAVDHFRGPEIVDIGVTYTDGGAVVTVTGELDVSNSTWLYECLHDAIDAGVNKIALDIERLTYLDSTGLRVLIEAHKRLQADGGSFAILNPTPGVARLLNITRGAPYLTVWTDPTPVADVGHLREPA